MYIKPVVLVLPLWWRVLLALRQYYEKQKRWPYVYNAGRYTLSSTVALFGLLNPFNLQGGHGSPSHSSVAAFQAIYVVLFFSSTIISCE